MCRAPPLCHCPAECLSEFCLRYNVQAVHRGAVNEQVNTSAKVLFAFNPKSEKREVSAIVLLLL